MTTFIEHYYSFFTMTKDVALGKDWSYLSCQTEGVDGLNLLYISYFYQQIKPGFQDIVGKAMIPNYSKHQLAPTYAECFNEKVCCIFDSYTISKFSAYYR